MVVDFLKRSVQSLYGTVYRIFPILNLSDYFLWLVLSSLYFLYVGGQFFLDYIYVLPDGVRKLVSGSLTSLTLKGLADPCSQAKVDHQVEMGSDSRTSPWERDICFLGRDISIPDSFLLPDEVEAEILSRC